MPKKRTIFDDGIEREYEIRFNELKTVHRFKFRIKKSGFTPQQKTAITRQWRKYASILNRIDEGTGIFKQLTKTQTRSLKSSADMIVSNKGVFVPATKSRTGIDMRNHPKVTVKGAGKKTRLIVTLKTRHELFFPRFHSETIVECYERLVIEHPDFDSVLMSVNGWKGRQIFDAKTFEKYIRDLEPTDAEIIAQGYDPVFTGFYVIFNSKKSIRNL